MSKRTLVKTSWTDPGFKFVKYTSRKFDLSIEAIKSFQKSYYEGLKRKKRILNEDKECNGTL